MNCMDLAHSDVTGMMVTRGKYPKVALVQVSELL